MSVIAAKVYDKEIVLAADSILVKGSSKRNSNFSKIIEVNDMIVGGTGSAEEISMMWHYMQTHKPAGPTEKDVLTFVIEFSQWKDNMGGGGGLYNSYLLAYKGHLFEIEHMFVHEIIDYIATGAGENFATAALYLGHSPKEAVKVACDLSCFVCEPIIEYKMPKDGRGYSQQVE